MKNLLILCLIFPLFLACPLLPDVHVNEGCNHSYYEFDNSVSFYPNDSIIKLGDTITVTSFVPREKWDRGSNYIFLLDSIDFHMGGGIIKLDTLIEVGKSYHFMSDFEWIADSIYNLKTGSNAYGFDFDYSEDGYNIKFNLIPKNTGIYLFDFNSLIIAAHSIEAEIIYTKNGECKTDSWNPYFKTNNGNNYRELLLQSPTEYYTGYYYDNWTKYNNGYGAHCFKVEE